MSPRLLIDGNSFQIGSVVSWPRVLENIWFTPVDESNSVHTTSPRSFTEDALCKAGFDDTGSAQLPPPRPTLTLRLYPIRLPGRAMILT